MKLSEHRRINIYIYIYIYRSEGLPLRDMLSRGAWRMGLGCSWKILPPPPSPSPSSCSPAPFEINSRRKSAFLVISHENDILGHFVFKRSFLDPILELCRTHRKRLYVLPEMNPKWLQMKKCFVRNNWGWDETNEIKGYALVQKVKFLKNIWKKEDQCTNIFHFADRPELTYEVDFRRNSFPNKWFSETLTCLHLCGEWFRTCPKRFLQSCNHFGLEPRRKMLPGS